MAKKTLKIQQVWVVGVFFLLDVYKFYKGIVLEQTDWENVKPLGRIRVTSVFRILGKEGENELHFACVLHKAIFTYPGGGQEI